MEGFIGQIILFAGNFAPRNWALCNGQLLPISSNEALFSIVGTAYGGDGRTTFALPDLRGRVPLGVGQGPGLADHRLGATGGSETHTLTAAHLPSHSHDLASGTVSIPISEEDADQEEGSGNFLANGNFYHDSQGAEYGKGPLGLSGDTGPVGGNQAFDKHPPYLALHYIICTYGTYPSRS